VHAENNKKKEMRRSHWLGPLVLGTFLIIWSSYVSAMMRLGAIQEFGATLKRQCDADTSIEYRRLSTFYDEFGNFETSSYINHKHQYLRQEFLKPTPRMDFTSVASPYDLATLAPVKD
jgi:hypothetical protein